MKFDFDILLLILITLNFMYINYKYHCAVLEGKRDIAKIAGILVEHLRG